MSCKRPLAGSFKVNRLPIQRFSFLSFVLFCLSKKCLSRMLGIQTAPGSLNALHLFEYCLQRRRRDWPHEVLVVFQDFISVKNYPCLTPSTWGSLGDLVREIVEINKTLYSLDLLVLLDQAKRTRKILLCSFACPKKHQELSLYVLSLEERTKPRALKLQRWRRIESL